MRQPRTLAAGVIALAAASSTFANDGPPSREASGAAAPGPVTLATPWPTVPPCARPTKAWIDDRLAGDVRWSSADGETLLRIPAARPNRTIELPRGFPAARVDHLTVAAFPAPVDERPLLQLECPGDQTVSWGPCGGGSCTVTASYRVPRVFKAARTDRWVKPMRYPGDVEEVGDIHYSLFFKRIGYRRAGDPEAGPAALRLTRDLVADLRTFLQTACARSTCGEVVVRVRRAADAYLAGHAVFEGHDPKTHNHWNRGWSWRATAGGVIFNGGCGDMREDPRASCWLETQILGEGRAVVEYRARTANYQAGDDLVLTARSDVRAAHPLGKIRFLPGEKEHGPGWLEISGRALATPVAPAGP